MLNNSSCCKSNLFKSNARVPISEINVEKLFKYKLDATENFRSSAQMQRLADHSVVGMSRSPSCEYVKKG